MSEGLWSAIGWTGTAIFLASFLVKSRTTLHLLGLVGCVVKLVYTWHYQLWPLAANWVILIGIEAAMWWRYRRDDSGAPSVEECARCQQ